MFGLGVKLLAVAVAGAAGALLRFGLSNGVYRVLGREFPYGTLVVNIVGSLLIGYFFVLFLERTIVSDAWRSAILIGLLGSFTTFSTFSLETLNLLNEGAYIKAMMNVVLSVMLCLAATWTGFALARQL